MLRDRPDRGRARRCAGACLLASILALPLVSCTDGEPPGGDPADGGEHAHVAPHGGALIVLGEEIAHVELIFDPGSGRAEAHILDAHAERGVPIDAMELRFAAEGIAAPLILLPVASALTGEETGRTSHFAGSWPELAGRTEFAATLESIRVRGVEFRGVAFRFPEGNEGAGKHDDPAPGDPEHEEHEEHDGHDGHDGHDH